jgi:hypothetical protein
MKAVNFSDNLSMSILPIDDVDYRQYKYRLKELFEQLLTAKEAKFYRKRLRLHGIKPNAFAYWSEMKADSSKSMHGDALEKLSDALGIPMRDLKYKE